MKGKEKIISLNIVQKAPRLQQALCRLGDEWDFGGGLADELENWTRTIYGYPRISFDAQENGWQPEKITKSSKVDLSNGHPATDLSSHKFRGQITVMLGRREPRRVL